MSNALTARMALAKHGFQYSHSLGQNFLLDDFIIQSIVDAAGVAEGDCVLEIGAGAGMLTAALCQRGANVLALELDTALQPVLQDVLKGHCGVSLVFEDALKADLPTLTKQAFADAPLSVVANLPYYITADLILRLLRSPMPLRRITIMVQKEAAERVMSAPGEKRWCALAATVQYFGRPQVLMDVPPEAFTPRPHIMSSLLQIALYEDKPVRVKDEACLLRLINVAFAMRRKTLVNNLSAGFGLGRERSIAMLDALGLNPRVRGEALTLAQLGALSDALLEA